MLKYVWERIENQILESTSIFYWGYIYICIYILIEVSMLGVWEIRIERNWWKQNWIKKKKKKKNRKGMGVVCLFLVSALRHARPRRQDSDTNVAFLVSPTQSQPRHFHPLLQTQFQLLTPTIIFISKIYIHFKSI